MELSIPVLLDDMKNTAGLAYKAWPDRLYIVAPDGTLAYAGGRGPRGFNNPGTARAARR